MMDRIFQRQNRFIVFCLIPLVLYLLVFTLVPIIKVFMMSLADPVSGKFSLSNYATLMRQEEFRSALLNTVIIAVGSLLIEVAAGLCMALVLSALKKGSGPVKSMFMLPLAIPTVVSAVMMSYLFSTSGWVNRILADIGLLRGSVVWLGGGFKSMFTIMIADSWKVTPLVMLILLAGLQSIDRQLYSSARMDGAGTFYIFRRITLPLLLPSLTAAIIIRGIDAFRIFSLVLVLMGENLKVVGTYAYLEYSEYNNYNLSAASSVILFVLIMLAVIAYIRTVGRKGLQPT
ncbi:MAG: ABC transporter permease subunit [Candidatus Omnitrophica bacterium]|nr:ABC transporter permease subunit [Candidatus Omnitrophota bacterium]